SPRPRSARRRRAGDDLNRRRRARPRPRRASLHDHGALPRGGRLASARRRAADLAAGAYTRGGTPGSGSNGTLPNLRLALRPGSRASAARPGSPRVQGALLSGRTALRRGAAWAVDRRWTSAKSLALPTRRGDGGVMGSPRRTPRAGDVLLSAVPCPA